MIQEHELRQMYHDDQMTMQEIGELCGVGQKTVSTWMRFCGIESRTFSEARLIKSLRLSKEELYNMYCVQKISLTKIAENIGVTPTTVSSWMKEYEIETRTISEAMLNGDFAGENSWNWKGGISFEPYCDKFNNLFKEAVRKRDNYTCQLCGYEQNGRKLSVHHVHYDKANCYPDVVALCCSCNSRVNTNRDYWEEYFENQLIERGLYCWSISNIIA